MRCATLALGLTLAFAVPVGGLEVDPYLAWLVDIPDSAPALNRYTTAMVSGHLQELAEKGRAANECSAAAESAMRHFHRSVMMRRRAMAFLKRSPDVAKWKAGGVWSSVWRSYYRRLAPLYFSSLAKTIDLDGVRLSLDKVGHFFGFGRRYYRRYRSAVASGLTPEEAEREVILWGLKQENLFVGKWIDTVFSHADLEANYQGMRFARDLCEGERPYLERDKDGAWALERDVDLRHYVTPAFDEGYNNNHFTVLGWPLVRKRLKRHCWILREPAVNQRLEDYRGRSSPSRSQIVIAEYYSRLGTNPQDDQSLPTLCGLEDDEEGSRRLPPSVQASSGD